MNPIVQTLSNFDVTSRGGCAPLPLSNVLVFGANILAFIHCFICGFFNSHFSISSKINVLGRDMRKSSAVNLNHHIDLVKQSSALKVEVRYDSLP